MVIAGNQFYFAVDYEGVSYILDKPMYKSFTRHLNKIGRWYSAYRQLLDKNGYTVRHYEDTDEHWYDLDPDQPLMALNPKAVEFWGKGWLGDGLAYVKAVKEGKKSFCGYLPV